jgi:GxxExxY protein
VAKNKNMISDYEELLAKEIVDCAFKVHKQLGPGLLEKIYEACLCHELSKRNINYKRQVDLQLYMTTLPLIKAYE